MSITVSCICTAEKECCDSKVPSESLSLTVFGKEFHAKPKSGKCVKKRLRGHESNEYSQLCTT